MRREGASLGRALCFAGLLFPRSTESQRNLWETSHFCPRCFLLRRNESPAFGEVNLICDVIHQSPEPIAIFPFTLNCGRCPLPRPTRRAPPVTHPIPSLRGVEVALQLVSALRTPELLECNYHSNPKLRRIVEFSLQSAEISGVKYKYTSFQNDPKSVERGTALSATPQYSRFIVQAVQAILHG